MGNLAEIVISTELLLSARPSRDPDHALENSALRELATEMAERPGEVLNNLCHQVMRVCGAESAGVSLLASPDSEAFFWPAISGLWQPYVGGGMPRSASPCGVVVRQDASLIFHDVVAQFPAAAAASPAIAEILLSPFRVNGIPMGTVWAIVHSDAKRFDNEDRRLLESLAQFAGAAYQVAEMNRAAAEAREQLSLVNHELAHRLKNMLTMVMAVASQTLKNVSEQDAVEAFQSRLQALGSAHDALLDQSWVAAPMQLVAERVLNKLIDGQRLTLNGPAVTLGPRSALSISLILHELATNAMKYGALSEPAGRVSFSWEVTEEAEPRLLATWREQGGPAVNQPSAKGFGTRLIGMGLTGRGGVKLSFPVAGFIAEFEAPLRLVQDQSREETAGAE